MVMRDRAKQNEYRAQRDDTGMRGGLCEGFSLAQAEARRSDTLLWCVSLGKPMRCQPAPLSAPLRRLAQSVLCSESGASLSSKTRKINLTSCGAGAWRRRSRALRKNIIGHEMASGTSLLRKDFFRRRLFGNRRGPLALVYQQAREHGAGGFIDPLIEQRANLFAQIGGMTETGEFVALQRITRSREKELPGRLSLGTGHRRLLEELLIT